MKHARVKTKYVFIFVLLCQHTGNVSVVFDSLNCSKFNCDMQSLVVLKTVI